MYSSGGCQRSSETHQADNRDMTTLHGKTMKRYFRDIYFEILIHLYVVEGEVSQQLTENLFSILWKFPWNS